MTLHQDFLRRQDLALATQRVLGRNTAGTGPIEAVTTPQLLEWLGTCARGDIIRREASAFNRYAIGTSGKALVSDGTDALWGLPKGTVVGYTNTVSGSAATTLTTTGFSMTNYFCQFSVAIRNASAGTNSISLYFNADATAGNYDTEQLLLDGATVTAARVNTGVVMGIAGNGVGYMWGILIPTKTSAGVLEARYLLIGNTGLGDGAVRFHAAAGRWRTTGTTVTDLLLSGSAASGLNLETTMNVFEFHVF